MECCRRNAPSSIIPRSICYLNAASWSPLPIAAQEAGRLGVARKGQPWLIDPALPAGNMNVRAEPRRG